MIGEIWRRGGVVYGASIRIGSPGVARLFREGEFDCVYIDLQSRDCHGPDVPSMIEALEGAGKDVLVRLAENDPGLIRQAIDAGADGVIIPSVESREATMRALATCREEAVQRAREIACVVMAETAAAVEHIDEIATAPGLGCVFIGPSDLARSLGVERPNGIQAVPGRHAQAVATIREACLRHGVPVGMSAGFHAGNGTEGDAKELKTLGYRYINLGHDATMLGAAVAALARHR